ncbi:MAG: Ribosomal RNA small subunit methyltransferase D [Bacteroidetes bacterium ADurb.Bin123]|nr:MAG: Ribosomal RNA small subunit methyltransferase D [Bacteroidetes bacterium ADurb.Bin123]
MRIVGGIYKGRHFEPGNSFRARPTTDFSKEGLFDILDNRVHWEVTDALDLFAGTGSISFELVSRGCRKVTAVEKDFVHCKFIRKVIAELRIDNLRLYQNDVFKVLARSGEAYDLVFADPPYDAPWFATTPESILNASVVKPGGLFILEHPKAFRFNQLPGFQEMRHYGSVHFSFFKPLQ